LEVSLGKATVYKHIPVYHPRHIGSVDGLGGFFLPVVYGVLLDVTGLLTAPFMVTFVLVAIMTMWMHVAIRRTSPATER
jgi:NNP family nitrate/nitrite transporter-like MFS transporter